MNPAICIVFPIDTPARESYNRAMNGLKLVLLLLVPAVVAFAGFMPSVRIDQGRRCSDASITVGPPSGQTQPLYVVMQDGLNMVLQKSTDAGASWRAENQLVRESELGAFAPDVTTDLYGNVYIAFTEKDSTNAYGMYCVRSTDGGATWSTPVKIDDDTIGASASLGRIAADPAGNLFSAWENSFAGETQVWSSVSIDRGTTWSPAVRVSNPSDTFYGASGDADVFVQPGTNHYLVAATGPFELAPGWISYHAYLYRSTDMGQTFEPGVQLDSAGASEPHVVADAQHVICDYNGDNGGDDAQTQARTLYTTPDTWGPRRPVTDRSYNSYYCGALAISPDGWVHTALMMNYHDGRYDACHAVSTDHGATWSRHERVNDDTTEDKFYPDIAADSAGHVYMVWLDYRSGDGEIWFSTNNWSPNAEHPEQPRDFVTVVHQLPPGVTAFDAVGRQAIGSTPGVYFVRAEPTAVPRRVLLVK
jgi:hypothetical protein